MLKGTLHQIDLKTMLFFGELINTSNFLVVSRCCHSEQYWALDDWQDWTSTIKAGYVGFRSNFVSLYRTE